MLHTVVWEMGDMPKKKMKTKMYDRKILITLILLHISMFYICVCNNDKNNSSILHSQLDFINNVF